MSNLNWICFRCREAVRRSRPLNAHVSCPKCGDKCMLLGTRIPVPPKNKVHAWRKLQNQRHLRHAAAVDYSLQYRVRRIHWLEKRIAELERMPSSGSNEIFLNKYSEELLRLKKLPTTENNQ